MKKNKISLSLIVICILIASLANYIFAKENFVTVKNGEFSISGKPYRYVGTNLWYAVILASDGKGGDRSRLHYELDKLQETGIDNLRILVGADGENSIASHVEPSLQIEPGIYNDTLLVGLDYLLVELEKREMKAILYLNNSWEWSGGYSTYLQWVGKGNAPIPSIDGWSAYMKYVEQFVNCEEAMQLSFNHVRNIVTRINSITGKPYTESPAIMSWQIANEPRAFSTKNKRAFASWILKTAKLIKQLDKNHMVSTGSEGKQGCEQDIELWNEIHSYPEIDYANIHIWPYNWGWIKKETIASDTLIAFEKTHKYISEHYQYMKKVGKPIVLEEFGYPRDNMSFIPGSSTTGRDTYYKYIFSIIKDCGMIAGCNFWGWGGFAIPSHKFWQQGDAYTGDPAQEEQGLNSVFSTDKSTLNIIEDMVKSINKNKKR